MNFLHKLMFWRKREEPEQPASAPDPRPNDPHSIDTSETPDEKAYREERQRELLEKDAQRVEEEAEKPPDYIP
jgi:hypothetical protein